MPIMTNSPALSFFALAVGTTALDGAEAEEVPSGLVAVTVKV